MIASKKLDTKCDGGGAEINRRRRDWSVDDLVVMEIGRGKSTIFDGAAGSNVCCCCATSGADDQRGPS